MVVGVSVPLVISIHQILVGRPEATPHLVPQSASLTIRRLVPFELGAFVVKHGVVGPQEMEVASGHSAVNSRLRPHFNRRVGNLNRRLRSSLIDREDGRVAVSLPGLSSPGSGLEAYCRVEWSSADGKGTTQRSCRPSTLSLDRIRIVQIHA
jgi:hypothetical protein